MTKTLTNTHIHTYNLHTALSRHKLSAFRIHTHSFYVRHSMKVAFLRGSCTFPFALWQCGKYSCMTMKIMMGSNFPPDILFRECVYSHPLTHTHREIFKSVAKCEQKDHVSWWRSFVLFHFHMCGLTVEVAKIFFTLVTSVENLLPIFCWK